jgi:subtilisin family serine protease
MKWLISLIPFLLIPTVLGASGRGPLQKVAVIDTGLDLQDPRFKGVLCREGHFDFVNNTPWMKDTHGHGTHVAGVIKKYADDANYCLIILKYYDEKSKGSVNLANMVKAIYRAAEYRTSIVNISASGPEFAEEEYIAIKDHPSITFVAAAGNDNKNVDLIENSTYPASYRLSNVISVGALQNTGWNTPKTIKLSSSNYGNKVKAWELGEFLKAEYPGNRLAYLSGTSQATAVYTGKLIKQRSK